MKKTGYGSARNGPGSSKKWARLKRMGKRRKNLQKSSGKYGIANL
jgi:hypothetical protein